MNRHITFIVITLVWAGFCRADTFKHRQTGEVFHGFVTQKSIGNRTRVYNAQLESFKPVNLADYDVTPNSQGRRNSVVVIPIKEGEVILSKVVSESVGTAIIDASNKGPKFIVLEIDCPGGRGDYMQQLCVTIMQTSNCPVIAYIGGGKFGGAYSAAAAVALACDKIYISPTTTIGAVAPLVAGVQGGEDAQSYTNMFSPQNLSAYRSYLSTLAQSKNRPSVLAMAMVDRNIEVIEVVDKKGGKTFINGPDKQPGQSVERKWTRVVDESGQMILTLTPNDAVYSRMADKIVNSLTELLSDMGAADARLTKSGQVGKNVRKFVAARRNINEVLTSIDYLQKRADELEKQLGDREKQERQNTMEREYMRGDASRFLGGTAQSDIYRRDSSRRRRPRQTEREIISGSAPVVDTVRLRNELALVLVDLAGNYNRAIGLARRWPGALPSDVTLQTLEKRLTSVRTLHNDIVFRRSGVRIAPGAGR
jgi:ATP-dependent protease ClpP protease subunit